MWLFYADYREDKASYHFSGAKRHNDHGFENPVRRFCGITTYTQLRRHSAALSLKDREFEGNDSVGAVRPNTTLLHKETHYIR